MKIPITSIHIPNRQRSDMGDLVALSDSMRENGQITPILVKPIKDNKWELVAGHRRTIAAMNLGWAYINGNDYVVLDHKVIPAGELTALQIQLIEYEENVRRKDGDWKE